MKTATRVSEGLELTPEELEMEEVLVLPDREALSLVNPILIGPRPYPLPEPVQPVEEAAELEEV